jgi:hypothetical protein
MAKPETFTITDRDRQEAKVLQTHSQADQRLVIQTILDQSKCPHLTADERREDLRRAKALQKLLNLKL